jgi:uncharacterized membrane protein YozB (DUF420 family)
LNALLEQEAMTIIFVSLGLGVVGIGFGWFKNKDLLQMHRWVMTSVIILNLLAIYIVMFPSLLTFYYDPMMDKNSPFATLQVIHSLIGLPTVAFALIFASNHLPKPTKRWMHITALFWLTSITLGAIVYFTMPN